MTTALYGGAIELAFNEKKHSYTVAGEIIPSVTQILGMMNKPALVPWAAKQGALYAREFLQPGQSLTEAQIEALCDGIKSAHRKKVTGAADIGSTVHAFAEAYLKGEHPDWPVDERARNAAEAFIAWAETNEIEMLYSERKIFSREHRFAGTVDIVARINGRLVVADIKTSNGLWDEMKLQVAAYQLALTEELGLPFEARMLLRFDKDGAGFEAHTLEPVTYPKHRDAFLACLTLHRAMNSLKTKEAA